MMIKAWSVYEKHAWGANEVDVNSLTELSRSSIFYSLRGVTIVDSLDTLLIMGLKDQFKKAQEWVEKSLDFYEVNKTLNKGQNINLFETNIRITGGLISAYYLTKNEVLYEKYSYS